MCGNHSPFQKKTQKEKKSARQIACYVSAADAHAIQTETWLVTLGNPSGVEPWMDRATGVASVQIRAVGEGVGLYLVCLRIHT